MFAVLHRTCSSSPPTIFELSPFTNLSDLYLKYTTLPYKAAPFDLTLKTLPKKKDNFPLTTLTENKLNMHFSKSTLAAALAAAPLALAQTYTDCNPTEKTCPNDTGLPASTFNTDFTKGSSSFTSWSAAAGTTITYDDNGAAFTIAQAGQAPTIQTDFYIFFGKIEVVMQASPGQGIVSSIVLESDDLDEIDWEWLGGDTTQVETNYFGKGNTSTYDRAIYYPVSSPQTTFHTYTIDWTSSAINFMIDGASVRTINYADCVGGANYPQTPMRLKLGNWAGGAAGEAAGTVEWAGGATDFSKAPFTMYVKSVSVENYNPATAYKWTDETGSYESIELVKSDGSSASAGTSSSVASPTASASSDSRTNAPTSMVSVNKLAQTDAAVSSTSSGAAPSTTVASMQSSSSPTGTKHSEGSSSLTTSVSSGSSGSATGSSKSSESATGSSKSASSASSTSSGSSASADSSASSTSASATPHQTTSGAASHGVARALVALGSIAFGIMIL